MTWNAWGWCGGCDKPIGHDRDPWWEKIDPHHYDDDGPYQVALGNGLYVDACWTCFTRWPREHVRPPWLTPAEREAFSRLNIVEPA